MPRCTYEVRGQLACVSALHHVGPRSPIQVSRLATNAFTCWASSEARKSLIIPFTMYYSVLRHFKDSFYFKNSKETLKLFLLEHFSKFKACFLFQSNINILMSNLMPDPVKESCCSGFCFNYLPYNCLSKIVVCSKYSYDLLQFTRNYLPIKTEHFG